MSYSKTIVCLANSRKLRGRCVAGREWNGRDFGAWIRPVSGQEKGELYAERYYQDRSDPKLLDVVEIALSEPRPVRYQSENHLVDAAIRWKHLGRITSEQLLPAIDMPAGPLWVNGESTGNGRNDKVRCDVADNLPNSLMLVRPEHLTMIIKTEGADFGNPRRIVRGHFSLAGHDYVLSVTDPVAVEPLRGNPDGFSSELLAPVLCISLSEKFESQNACFKLIAGVIRV